MGGSIRADSGGGGASFSVRLPRAPRRRAQSGDS